METGHTNRTPTVQERPDEALPFGNLLNLVKKDGLLPRSKLAHQLDERGEIFRREAEEPCVLEVAVEGTLAAGHQLGLKRALAAPADAGEDQGSKGSARNGGEQFPLDFRFKRRKRLLILENGDQCTS